MSPLDAAFLTLEDEQPEASLAIASVAAQTVRNLEVAWT